MPIHRTQSKERIPVEGIIRLGVKKVSQNGSEYPATVEYFVLDDAPEVLEKYGPEPKEIDVLFCDDSLDKVIPTWYKWYSSGKKNSDGTTAPGRLNCYGTGPKETIDPVTGESKIEPGEATHLADRDPATSLPKKRGCLAENCPDFYNAKGQQQCKQTMTVNVFLPLVSPYGVFQIHTSSWNSIQDFWDRLSFVKKVNNDKISFVPFKLVRVEKLTEFYDKKTQKMQQGRQFIMQLKPNEEFNNRFPEVSARLQAAFGPTSRMFLPDSREAAESTVHSLAYRVDDLTHDAGLIEAKKLCAEDILKDPEVIAAFAKRESVLGPISDQQKLLGVRKYENEPDIKAAVIFQIEAQIEKKIRVTEAVTPQQ
jgi:hypothetical protein